MEVRDGERPLTVRGHKRRALLAVLLLHANQPVAIEQLIEDLWEGDAPPKARQSLHLFVHRLRQDLRAEGKELLDTQGAGYLLNVRQGELDTERFQQHVRRARSARDRGDLEQAAAGFQRALGLWRGPALADFTGAAFASAAVARLQEQRLAAITDRIDVELQLGRHGELLGELEALVRQYPFAERLRGQLILALYRSGRQADALDAYRAARQALADELGLEPGPELRRLERSILRQDGGLDLTGNGGPVPAAVAAAATVTGLAGDAAADAARGAEEAEPEQAPAREERRTVTVLVASVLHQEHDLDPEDRRARLEAAMGQVGREVERFGGQVYAFAGELALAVFGAPRTHEDDPERAVRAGLALLESLGEAAAPGGAGRGQVGVDTGPALVLMPTGPAGAVQVSGEVVGLATRLHGAAGPGGVLVGRSTWRATTPVIEYAPIEPDPLGRDGPRLALRPRSRVGVAAGHATRAPLVAREHEVALLRELLARAREELEPQLVTVVGVPGIGKSRLVHELSQIVEADPDLITWRQGRSLPYGEGVAFLALAEIVKAHAGILETDGTAPAERKLRRAVADALGGETDAAWVEGYLRQLIGSDTGDVASTERRSEAFAAWRRFIEALASKRALVMVFEDLHWADDALLDFIDDLASTTLPLPLLVACTTRPELLDRRRGWGGGKRNATTVSLPPLSEQSTGDLLSALLDGFGLPHGARAELLARSGGNPLYIEEYVRMLRDRGVPVDGPGEDGALPMPDSIQRLIAARLDDLPTEDKEVLADAAVIGEVGWVGGLAAVSERGREEVTSALLRLERRELLRRTPHSSVAGEVEYAFRHVLVRDVAYEQLPRAERAQRHRRAAGWLATLPADQAEPLAHHALQAVRLAEVSGQPTDVLAKDAREALRAAGNRAASLGAWGVAARHYSAALELWSPKCPEWPDLLYRTAQARYEADGGSYELFDQARDALLAAGDRARAAEMQMRSSQRAWSAGDKANVWAFNDAALAMVDGLPPSRSTAFVLVNNAFHHFTVGDLDVALPAAREALTLIEQLGDEELRGRTLGVIGLTRVTGGDLDGLADLERGIAVLREHAPAGVGGWLINFANGLGRSGDLDGAFAAYAEAERVSRRFALGRSLAWLAGIAPRRSYWTGRWDEGMHLADRFLADEAKAKLQIATTCLVVRGQIRLGRGDREGMLADAERAVTGARRLGSGHEIGPALALQARALLETGQVDEAAALTEELLGELRGKTMEPFVGADLPVLFSGLGWPVERLLDAGVAATPWLEAATTYLSGDLVGAAKRYASMGARSTEAYTRLRAAEQLTRDSRPAAAVTELAAARGFFLRAGANAWLWSANALRAELERA
jgi:DNA-binding SARP family transcriptional activator/class 3 adenylate cyclase